MTSATTSRADTAEWLSGFIPDLPTPFDHRDDIDTEAFGRLCERQIAAGASALVVGEAAGESSTLEPAERVQLVRIAAGIARKRVRIIAGAGSNATDRAVTFTRAAQAAGDTSSLAWLAAGGDGCISAVANVAPDLHVAVYRHFRAGRLYQARELHQRLVPLASLLEREHPAALKFALALLGFMQPATRLPIVQLGATAKSELAQAMAELADEYLAAAQ